MIKHADSHLDHGLTPAQVDHILNRFGDRIAFFIETFELPLELGFVQCGLYGPAMGDAPVSDDDVMLDKRKGREWESRFVTEPTRPTRTMTVIAGPHLGHPCVLFTAFGGPLAPQEPGDPDCKDLEASQKFWSEHALSMDT